MLNVRITMNDEEERSRSLFHGIFLDLLRENRKLSLNFQSPCLDLLDWIDNMSEETITYVRRCSNYTLNGWRQHRIRLQTLKIESKDMKTAKLGKILWGSTAIRFRSCECKRQIIITLMAETVRSSETSVFSNETPWRYIPEGSHLHTRRSETLNSYKR
jgi:hypothetical protein